MIYVTENGVSEKMMCTELCDEWRIQYFRDYINEMLKGRFFFTLMWTHTCLVCVCVTVFFGVSQRSKMASTWGATLPGRCSISLSGTRATPSALACTTWTSGTKTSHATRKPLSSSISALSVPTDFPIRERWNFRFFGRSQPFEVLMLELNVLWLLLNSTGWKLEEEVCGDLFF